MNEREFIEMLRTTRSGNVIADTYEAIVSAIQGYDIACSGGFLVGFQELVELKNGQTTNVYWSSLVLSVTNTKDADEESKIRALLDLIDELLTVDRGTLGRRRLYYEWVAMAQSEHWHNPELLRYDSSPRMKNAVTVNEAASNLGIAPVEILKLIRSNRLRVAREGAEPRISSDQLDGVISSSSFPHDQA